MKTVFTAMIFAAFTTCAAAQSVIVTDATAFATSKGAMTGAGYFTITNNGTGDDVLLAIEGDYPRIMMHDTEMTDGIARMNHLMSVAIPLGETLTFEPGGKHVMFMGLQGKQFVAGDAIATDFIFENAGRVEAVFDVVARN